MDHPCPAESRAWVFIVHYLKITDSFTLVSKATIVSRNNCPSSHCIDLYSPIYFVNFDSDLNVLSIYSMHLVMEQLGRNNALIGTNNANPCANPHATEK